MMGRSSLLFASMICATVLIDAGCSASHAGADTTAPITFDVSTTIAGGQETLTCRYVQMPKDRGSMAIAWAESHFTQGSHHFVAMRTSLTELPPGSAKSVDCTAGDFDANLRGYYYEAQLPESQRVLPAGVAHVFAPGEVLLLQTHYVNPSAAALEAKAELVMHPMPLDQVKEEAGALYFYNPRIDLPAHGKAKTTLRCPVRAPLFLSSVWSHMHARGVSFVAETASGKPLYSSTNWAEPTPQRFEGGLKLEPGDAITFTCEFQNDSPSDVVSGPSATTDEMCVMHGLYWPRQALATELCELGTTDGEGTATTRQTLHCLLKCIEQPTPNCQESCWDGACPRASMSAAGYLRCLGDSPACRSRCANPTTDDCAACLKGTCADRPEILELDACQ